MNLLIIFLLAQGAFCEILCPEEGKMVESPKEANWLRESPFVREGESERQGLSEENIPEESGFQRRELVKRPKSVTMTLFKRELSPDGVLKGASMYRVCAKSGEGTSRPSITTTLVSVVANEREEDGNEKRKKLEAALREWAKRRRERRRMIIISQGMGNSIGKRMPFSPISIGNECKGNGTRRIIIRYRIPMIMFRVKRKPGSEGVEEAPRVRIIRFIPLRRPSVEPQFQTTIPKPPYNLPTPPPQLSPFKNNSQSIPTPSKKYMPSCFKHLLSLMWPNYTTNPDGFIQRFLDKTNSLFSSN